MSSDKCGDRLTGGIYCALPPGHEGAHTAGSGDTWTRAPPAMEKPPQESDLHEWLYARDILSLTPAELRATLAWARVALLAVTKERDALRENLAQVREALDPVRIAHYGDRSDREHFERNLPRGCDCNTCRFLFAIALAEEASRA